MKHGKTIFSARTVLDLDVVRMISESLNRFLTMYAKIVAIVNLLTRNRKAERMGEHEKFVKVERSRLKQWETLETQLEDAEHLIENMKIENSSLQTTVKILEKRMEEAEGERERLSNDIRNARDWLFPGRKIQQVDIDSCIDALDVIINILMPTPGTETPDQER